MGNSGESCVSDSEGKDQDSESTLLSLASKLARIGGWSLDVSTGLTTWTSTLYPMLGIDPHAGSPPIDDIMSMYREPDRAVMTAALAACVEHGTPFDLESVMTDARGRTLRVRTIGEAVRGGDGRVERIRGAFYDITELASQREKLERRLNDTLDQIQDGLVFFDRQWRYTYLNQTAERYLQNTADHLIGRVMWEEYKDSYDSEFGVLYRRAMDARETGSVRAYYPELDTWFESTAYPTDDGIAVYLRDVSIDESNRQRAADEAARAIELAALLDASTEAMIMEDLENVVTYWNHGAEAIYGWTREEAVGRNIRELIYADPAAFEAPAAALLRDGHWSGEMVQQAKDGRVLVVQCRWQAVRDDQGKPVRLFAVNSDITQQRRQQEMQYRAQRMESLGTLAGGIAHDLNNVLTPLLMSVQLMRSIALPDDHREMLDGMELGIKRGADMIRQVLTFARGVDGVRELVTVNDIIAELSSMSFAALPKAIAVETTIDEPLPIVGDKTQILQVLMNLVTNARDAMPEGGVIRLAVKREHIDDYRISTSTLAPGHYAVISVEDSGVGMAREVLDKVFEPFFTTKGHGEGTGLGLPSSIAIVRSHGGTITVYSEPGHGSRFAVYLPLATEDQLEAARDRPEGPVPTGSGERVLIVDDEASIRRIVRLALEAHGYLVVEASNGREAIAVAEQYDDIRLMLTDMMMPVMDGAATAAHFAEHRPQVAIVATSGLNANGGVARAQNSGVRNFIAKPFTTDELVRTVAAALAGSSGSAGTQ